MDGYKHHIFMDFVAILRRSSVLVVELERLELAFATAGAASPDDLDLYSRVAANVRRLLESVAGGLGRRVTPSFTVIEGSVNPDAPAGMLELARWIAFKLARGESVLDLAGEEAGHRVAPHMGISDSLTAVEAPLISPSKAAVFPDGPACQK